MRSPVTLTEDRFYVEPHKVSDPCEVYIGKYIGRLIYSPELGGALILLPGVSLENAYKEVKR